MKRKSILVLILAVIVVISISFVECGNSSSRKNVENNNVGKTEEDNIKQAKGNVENSAEAAKDNMEAVRDSIKYTAANVKEDIIKTGYTIKESTNTNKNYFKGNETDYLIENDLIRVYEYNSVTDLESDVKRISPNGLNINGTDANYTRKPYYYQKGNSLIVYEGAEPAYIDEFKTLYGNTIIP